MTDSSQPGPPPGDGSRNDSGRDGASRPAASAGAPVKSRFYGTPLPRVSEDDLSGTLIVIEGTDGSGRSTQIALLQEWL